MPAGEIARTLGVVSVEHSGRLPRLSQFPPRVMFPKLTELLIFLFQNSIRHNLSLHDMFVRETSANGKVSFWTIHPSANRYLTLDQVFKVIVPVSSREPELLVIEPSGKEQCSC